MLDKDMLTLLFEKLGFVGLIAIVIYFLMSKAPTIIDLIHTNNKRNIAKINDALNDENLEEGLKFILFEELNKLYFGSVTGVMVSQKKRNKLVAILKECDNDFNIKELYIFHDLYEYNSTTKEIHLIRNKNEHLKEIKLELGFIFLIVSTLVSSFIFLENFEGYVFIVLGLLLCMLGSGIYINLLQLNFIKKFND